VLDQPIASALNRLLDSQLRVEVDEATKPAGTGVVNLTSLARQIQATLDDLGSASADELALPRTTEESGFRIVWHARLRRAGEESEPVIA
jgi:hypothetical protein